MTNNLRYFAVSLIVVLLASSLPAIADPPPPPGAPLGHYVSIVGNHGALGLVTYPNGFFGATCEESDTIQLSRFSFDLPAVPNGKVPKGLDGASNGPSSGPQVVFTVPIARAQLWIRLTPSYANCVAPFGWQFPKGASLKGQLAFLSGQYSSDGIVTLSFANASLDGTLLAPKPVSTSETAVGIAADGTLYPPMPPGALALSAKVTGTMTNWKRTATITFTRADQRDSNFAYSSAIVASFSYLHPKPIKQKKQPQSRYDQKLYLDVEHTAPK